MKQPPNILVEFKVIDELKHCSYSIKRLIWKFQWISKTLKKLLIATVKSFRSINYSGIYTYWLFFFRMIQFSYK